RRRSDADFLEVVESAAERDEVLRPQPAEHLDLLGLAGTAGLPVHTERLVFDEIPAGADPEPETSAGQDVGFGRLLRADAGRALRQNQRAAGRADRLGHGGEEAQSHEGLVERVALVVERGPAVARGSAEHVVGDLDAGITEVLRRLRPIADLRVVRSDVAGREEGVEPHGGRPGWSLDCPLCCSSVTLDQNFSTHGRTSISHAHALCGWWMRWR